MTRRYADDRPGWKARDGRRTVGPWDADMLSQYGNLALPAPTPPARSSRQK